MEKNDQELLEYCFTQFLHLKLESYGLVIRQMHGISLVSTLLDLLS